MQTPEESKSKSDEENRRQSVQSVVRFRPSDTGFFAAAHVAYWREDLMKNLTEVEQARALMTEAIDWSVIKWLSEKKRVRRAADLANEILNAEEAKIHKKWSPEFRSAYEGKTGARSPEIKRLAGSIRREHDAANRFRMDAENTFEGAEKRLSTAMAREGCRQAIEGWTHHLEAIRLAEAAVDAG